MEGRVKYYAPRKLTYYRESDLTVCFMFRNMAAVMVLTIISL